MPRPEFPANAVVLGNDDVANAGKVRDLTPTVDRLAEECGATVRTETNEFGREEKVATVPFALAVEAMKPAWQRDTAHQMDSQSRRPTEELRDAHGGRRKVWSIHAEQVAKELGLKPVIHWGRPARLDDAGCFQNGHTHLGEPWPWQVSTCPGCLKKRKGSRGVVH